MQPISITIPVITEPHRQPRPAEPAVADPVSPDFAGARAYIAASAEGREGLVRFARAISSLPDSVHRAIADEDREREELGLLEDMQIARANTAAFAQSFVEGNKGEAARDASHAMAAFQLERMEALREKYRGNPASLGYVENQLAALARKSVGDMADYGIREHRAYKERIYQGELEAARAVITDQNTPETVRRATLADLSAKTGAFFPGEERAAALERLEEFTASAWKELWLGRLDSLRASDPEAALRLSGAALDRAGAKNAGDAGGGGSEADGKTSGTPARTAAGETSGKIPAVETALSGEVPAPAATAAGPSQTAPARSAAGETFGTPARNGPERGLALCLSPEELAVEHRKNERAAALREQQRAGGPRDRADQRYAALRQSLALLPAADQEDLGLAFLDDIPDPALRERMQTFFASDLEQARRAEKASDNAASRAFRARIASQGLGPAQALALLPAAEGLSDAARAALERDILDQTPPVRETRANLAALDGIRLAVDSGDLTRPEEIEIMAADHGLTDAQTGKALDYLARFGAKSAGDVVGGMGSGGTIAGGTGSETGGGIGSNSAGESGSEAAGESGSGGTIAAGLALADGTPGAGRVNGILRVVSGGRSLDDFPGFYDRLIQSLPLEPGKALSEAELRRHTVELLESGKDADGNWTLGDDDRAWARRLGIDPPDDPSEDGGPLDDDGEDDPEGGILVADASHVGGATVSDAADGLLLAAAKSKGGGGASAKGQGKGGAAGKTPKPSGGASPVKVFIRAEDLIKKIGRVTEKEAADTLATLLALKPDHKAFSGKRRGDLVFLQMIAPKLEEYLAHFSEGGDYQQTDPRLLWEKMAALEQNKGNRLNHLNKLSEKVFTGKNLIDWLSKKRAAYGAAYQKEAEELERDERFSLGKYSQDEVFEKVDEVMEVHKHSLDAPDKSSLNIYKTAPQKGKILGEVRENARERDRARVPLLAKGAAGYAAGLATTDAGRAEINAFLAERDAPYIAENWVEPKVTDTIQKKAPPAEYAKMVEEEAGRLALPIRMCIAMMVVESNGDPKATSPAGARGLMQVTPVTVKELAACDPDRFGKLLDEKGKPKMAALEDPETGIEVGLAALKMYMDRYDGDAQQALMAYNLGPDNAKARNFDLSKAPKETQNYVESIQHVLGSTDGSPKVSATEPEQSGAAQARAEKLKKAPLPKKSLLHYLTPKEAAKYRPAMVPSLTQ